MWHWYFLFISTAWGSNIGIVVDAVLVAASAAAAAALAALGAWEAGGIDCDDGWVLSQLLYVGDEAA